MMNTSKIDLGGLNCNEGKNRQTLYRTGGVANLQRLIFV